MHVGLFVVSQLAGSQLAGSQLADSQLACSQLAGSQLQPVKQCLLADLRPGTRLLAAMCSGNHLCGSEGFFTMLRCWDAVVCTSPQ